MASPEGELWDVCCEISVFLLDCSMGNLLEYFGRQDLSVVLTHCGLVMLSIYLSIQWHISWTTFAQEMACWHQAITQTNVEYSIVRFCGCHPRAISQQVSKLLFCIMSLKIKLLRLLPHLPGANELNMETITLDCWPVVPTVGLCPSKFVPTSSKLSLGYLVANISTFGVIVGRYP